MADSGFGQYLPALSHLLGEVESPTQTGQMQSPSFGGQPSQLGQILSHPHVQQLLQQFGINFDPSQIRQSPFLPNAFMQGHPHLGGALSGAMANVAATPEAPLVSGAGSGMTRAMQGMMGGPEMQRQYQVRQMMAPFQAMGMQMPAMEFGRKQQLLDLLTKMEQDRAQQSTQRGEEPNIHNVAGGYVTSQYQQPQPQGQPQPQAGPWGGASGISSPLSPGGQSQMMSPGMPAQPGGWQQTEHMTDPAVIAAQSAAKDPLKAARAKEQGAETAAGMPGARVDETKSKAERNRAQGAAARDRASKTGSKGDNAKYSKQYNDVEKQFATTQKQLQAALAAKTIDQPTHDQMLAEATATRETSKANIDKARGDVGASSRGLGPGNPGYGAVAPPSANQPAKQGGRQSKGGKQGQPDLHRDDAGNIWDISSGKPVLHQAAPQQQQPPPQPQQ